MGDYPICISATVQCGMTTAEQLQALQEQRRLVAVLLEDIDRTRHRLTVPPGAGAAWQSPAQRQYLLRRGDLQRGVGRVVRLLEETRESLTATIAGVVRG